MLSNSFRCQKCRKALKFKDAPIDESAIMAFTEHGSLLPLDFSEIDASATCATIHDDDGNCGNQNGLDPPPRIAVSSSSASISTSITSSLNWKQRGKQAVDMLGESFVVLPSSSKTKARLKSQKHPRDFPSSSIMNETSELPLSPAVGGGDRKRDELPSAPSSSSTVVATDDEHPIIINQSTNFDNQVIALTTLFEIAGDKTKIEQPLCNHCHQSIAKEIDRRLELAIQERDEFSHQLQRLSISLSNTEAPVHSHPSSPPLLSSSSASSSQSSSDSTRERERKEREAHRMLKDEERELESKLKSMQKERVQVQESLAKLQRDSLELDRYEREFWSDYQNYQLEIQSLGERQKSVKQQIKTSHELLTKLKRVNVYDDAFHISYDGHFGTISGFRLGRLMSQQVDWEETNAALGQVVLLLHTMTKKLGFTFSTYRLIPNGSFSRVGRLDDLNTTHELYGYNDLSIGRLFWYRRFDTALCWLLECVGEFGMFAQRVDQKFRLQYPIEGDKIGGMSVKLQFNQDAKWTKALKYLLTNLKLLLVWVTRRYQQNNHHHHRHYINHHHKIHHQNQNHNDKQDDHSHRVRQNHTSRKSKLSSLY